MAIYEIVLEGRQGTEDMLSVLHYDVTGATPPDWQALADVFRVHLVDHMVVLCPPNTTWQGITVRLDILGRVGMFHAFTAGTLAGTATNQDVFTQGAMQVNKNTLSETRPTKGRIYQGGLAMVGVGPSGLWETVFRTPVQAFWEDVRVINFAGPTTAEMVVKASNPSAPNTEPYNLVSTITTSPVPVTQRRRKIGVGA